MGESDKTESDFVRVVVALFKDDIETALKNVYNNRIKPTLKRTAADSLKDLVDQTFGIVSNQSAIPAGSVVANGQKTEYNKMFKGENNKLTTTSISSPSSTTKSDTNYNGLPNYVTVGSNEEAQNIIKIMNDILLKDGEVSVNDFFDFAGQSARISGNSAAPLYGWDNIDAASITEMADGKWLLSMPRYKFLGR